MLAVLNRESSPAASDDMADFEAPTYSKREIVEAGKSLKEAIEWSPLSQQRILDTFKVAHNWRSAHIVPMRHLRAELSAKARKVQSSTCVTAARLKRMSSIRKKLKRAPHTLYQMQDIGGCRIILDNMIAVDELAEIYGNSALHKFMREDDHVTNPKVDGYRSKHLVYRYIGQDRFEGLNSNPLIIELQLRTKMQHAWATAVEAVGMILGEDLKGGEGSSDWLRFFALLASEIAEDEGRSIVPNTPEAPERRKELRDLDKRLNAVTSLESLRVAVAATASMRTRISTAFMVSFDVNSRQVSVSPVGQRIGSAYDVAERKGGALNTVLVEVDKADDLRIAYPNYFLDVGIFTARAKRALGGAPSARGLSEILAAWSWR